VACNAGFRLGALISFARRIGARRVATGHYVRTCERHGRLLLARAADPAKDQSYMLARVDPRFLDRLWFPLGAQGKEETRAEARAAGLAVAGRPESQEACFLAGDDYRSFLARHGLPPREGPIVDLDGTVIGRHEGYWRFTPGQRRGLAVASSGEALYTIEARPEANAVVAGPRAALARTAVSARNGRLYVPVARAEAKLRYRSPAVGATVHARARGFRLELEEPFYGVAAGQTAVLYDGDAVVGAGVISSSR
jgi:tRNA-specific 2-thiouridylase